MRMSIVSLILVCPTAAAVRGQDKPAAPKAIVERALKALGGDKLDKFQGGRVSTKGTLDIQGGVPFTQQVTTCLPNQFKDSLELTLNGKKVTVVTVFNGKEGWLSINGQTKAAEDKVLDELKEGAYMMRIGRLLLKDEGIELSALGEMKIDGKPTVGVRISAKGHRDVNLYFDTKTYLPVKLEHRTHDFMTNQDVTEDRLVKEYMEVDGIKVPRKVEIRRDGKKFMEVEVTDMKFLETVDKDEFAKP